MKQRSASKTMFPGQLSPFSASNPHRSPYEKYFPPYHPSSTLPPALRPSPPTGKPIVKESPFVDPNPHRSPYEKFFPPYHPSSPLPPSLRPSPSNRKALGRWYSLWSRSWWSYCIKSIVRALFRFNEPLQGRWVFQQGSDYFFAIFLALVLWNWLDHCVNTR